MLKFETLVIYQLTIHPKKFNLHIKYKESSHANFQSKAISVEDVWTVGAI